MPNDAPRRSQESPVLKRRFRGLDPDAVRRLLDRRESEREDLEGRLAQLEAEHAGQQAELEELREREHLISGAITIAQRAADQIVADADEAAAARLAAAEAEVEGRLDRAEEQLAELTGLARTLAGDLIDQAEHISERLSEARLQLRVEPEGTPTPEEPPPLPIAAPAPQETAPAPPVAAPAAPPAVEVVAPVVEVVAPAGIPDGSVADTAEVARALDDLPPEGDRIVRIRLEPVGSPADVATAERRLHDLNGVRTVRLDDLGGGSATLLVGIDAEHLDVGPLLEAGAELVSADRDTIELRVPDGWC